MIQGKEKRERREEGKERLPVEELETQLETQLETTHEDDVKTFI